MVHAFFFAVPEYVIINWQQVWCFASNLLIISVSSGEKSLGIATVILIIRPYNILLLSYPVSVNGAPANIS